MMTLAAEKRDPEVKAKKLRREGYSTGVLYGREMKENVSLKYTEKDALNFIKKAKEGAQTMLDISGEKVDALVKNIDYDPLSKKILALDFQALVAGEVVAATVPVTFVNEVLYRVSSNRRSLKFTTKQIRHIFWTRLKLIWQSSRREPRPYMLRT